MGGCGRRSVRLSVSPSVTSYSFGLLGADYAVYFMCRAVFFIQSRYFPTLTRVAAEALLEKDGRQGKRRVS